MTAYDKSVVKQNVVQLTNEFEIGDCKVCGTNNVPMWVGNAPYFRCGICGTVVEEEVV